MAKINGSTIPTPSAVSPPEIEHAFRGGMRVKASGAVTADWIEASDKKAWKLSWTLVNATAYGQLKTAHAAVLNATASGVTYLDPSGDTYYVTADPQDWKMQESQQLTGGGLRYNVSFSLREV